MFGASSELGSVMEFGFYLMKQHNPVKEYSRVQLQVSCVGDAKPRVE